MTKALFLDRDGVICHAMPRGKHLIRWEQFQVMPGIRGLIKQAKEGGYHTIVITNQSPVSRGLLSFDDLGAIHRRMQEMLGGTLDRIYFCPHQTIDRCLCRKPQPGMIEKAIEDFDIDPFQSMFIGDSYTDVLAGRAAGVKTIFLKNQFNRDELYACEPHHVVDRLEDVHHLL